MIAKMFRTTSTRPSVAASAMAGSLWLAGILMSLGCGGTPGEPENKAAAPPPEVKTIEAELIGSDGSWGNTEGPAFDSKGTLYFTSRGTYKGIVSWTSQQGAQQYLAVATKAGPGGLWIDAQDNIYLTATDERQIQKVSPDKQVSVVAEKFEADPKVATGPNDIVVAGNGTIYFTDPNGYDGSAPNGTVYRIDPAGKTTVFSDAITGPNGIVLSADEKTLYVSHNISASTSKVEEWPLNEDGSAGAMKEMATVEPCVADGMAVDQAGNIWLACYSYGTAYLLNPQGAVVETVTTEQKALTNVVFGRGADNHSIYLSSSDMDRVTGYVYRATVSTPGLR